jgi:hypothetical protein
LFLYNGGNYVKHVVDTSSSDYTVTWGNTLPSSEAVVQIDTTGKLTYKTAGLQTSVASGSFSTSSTSYDDVTNLVVNIATRGRPVLLMIVPDGSGTAAQIRSISTAAVALNFIGFFWDGNPIAEIVFGSQYATSGTLLTAFPPSAFQFIHTPAAGSHSYKVRAKVSNGSTDTVLVSACKLIAMEL